MEKKLKHLELIQCIINRMSGNSFMLKGWAVTLVVGIFALATKDADKSYFIVAYIPVIIFWGLDAYYLLQEHLYRLLYDKVRMMTEEAIDFSLNVSPKELKIYKFFYVKYFFSITEVGFYLPLALVSVGIIIITHV